MKHLEWSVVLVVAVVAIVVWPSWSYLQAPAQPWPALVSGFAYSPFRDNQQPGRGAQPGREEIRADLQILARRTRAIRIYSLDGELVNVPQLAAELGMQVTVGIALHADGPRNLAALEQLRTISKQHSNVPQVIVGNETLLESHLDIDAVAHALDLARRNIDVPVSTAEPWHIWLQYPSLANHVDFITVHLLPWWEGVALDDAARVISERLRAMRARFPAKRIVIGEVGWPSGGRVRFAERTSASAQARFLSEFVAHAENSNEEYFLLEAFDQPWKWRSEGEVGAHWGVFDASRRAKTDFQTGRASDAGAVMPGVWFSAVFACILFVLRRDGRAMQRGGRVLLCGSAFTASALMVWVVTQGLTPYWNIFSGLFFVVLLTATASAVLLLLCEAHEWAEARWLARPGPCVRDRRIRPMVSVHVPICNEPPQMVIATLNALAAMRYAHYEVIVIDNNTQSAALWQPVQRTCEALGHAFRFVHRDTLAGFKAGALNLALQHTAANAQLIAVVDADYQVQENWLCDLVGIFEDEKTDIVQAPQDYRDGHCSWFKRFCEAEYSGFFALGMVVRDRRNAIIQHGTMTIVRRAALDAVGGWGEWCITEDAELGVRVLAAGGVAHYVPRSYGQGLTPDNFLDYKRQRFRWALGAVHILRAHARALLRGTPGSLGRGQRYHFVAGWLPWLADGASVLCTLAAVLATVLMHQWPNRVAIPILSLCTVPIVLCLFRAAKHVHLYRSCVRASWLQTGGAALAGMALMPTAGMASLFGILGIKRDFMRTPKFAHRHQVLGALASVRGELAMFAAVSAAAVAGLPSSPFFGVEAFAWQAMLAVMALPYASAVAMALIAALPLRTEVAARTLRPSPSRES